MIKTRFIFSADGFSNHLFESVIIVIFCERCMYCGYIMIPPSPDARSAVFPTLKSLEARCI